MVEESKADAPLLSAKTEFLPADSTAETLRTIRRTRWIRFALLAVWSSALLSVAGPEQAAGWLLAASIFSIGRSIAEFKFAQKLRANHISESRAYPVVAMLSNIVWATAPVIALLSNHAGAREMALIMVATGFMFVVTQFKASPLAAFIASLPYSGVVVLLLVESGGSAHFWPLFSSVVLLLSTVIYALNFSYTTHMAAVRSEEERKALISQLEAARIEAERASEAKSMFLANMSHEIRTPMNGVLGMAQLLEKTSLDSRQSLFVETIVKSGNALLTLINDILDFSKIEAGKLELEDAPFDLLEAVEDVVTLILPKAAENNIEVILRYQPDLPTALIGDGGRIRQIITNLLSNAVKFTKEGHVLIEVSGGVEGRRAHLRVEVTDTGIGMDAIVLERIFKAFEQADSSTTKRFGGTGLGLSISKHLVHAMQGQIGADSTPGKGSTFWVELSLPLQEKISQPRVKMSFDASRPVLIVDDNQVNRDVLTEQLSVWGFQVRAASSGDEALKILVESRAEGLFFGLAILDNFMPGMDGEELTRKIKLDPRFSHLPIIMLTSGDRDDGAARFRQLGVVDYFIKPARAALLKKAVFEAVSIARPEAPPVRRSSMALQKDGHGLQAAPRDGPLTRLLLAEDNHINQLVIAHMLDPSVYKLTTVDNGLEAVHSYEKDPAKFDVILMDISMPKMDGFEATRIIREFEREKQLSPIPIICLTAHVMEAELDRSREVGMNAYLTKPVNKDKLVSTIDKHAVLSVNPE